MSVIAPFNTFANGAATDADPAMENLYHPVAAPDSIEGMNGWLDKTNIAAPPNDWAVKRTQVRPQSMTRAGMVGLTGHADYLNTFDRDASIYVPIPGASIAFYLPRAASLTLLTWQIVGAGDEAYGSAGDPAISLRFFLNGTYEPSTQRYVAAPAYTVAGDGFRLTDRDRVYSGHMSYAGATALAAGWHTAQLAVYKSVYAYQARFRVRNMKHIAFF
jgi:hypothetical protein